MPHDECSLCLFLSRQFEWELKLKKSKRKRNIKRIIKISKLVNYHTKHFLLFALFFLLTLFLLTVLSTDRTSFASKSGSKVASAFGPQPRLRRSVRNRVWGLSWGLLLRVLKGAWFGRGLEPWFPGSPIRGPKRTPPPKLRVWRPSVWVVLIGPRIRDPGNQGS